MASYRDEVPRSPAGGRGRAFRLAIGIHTRLAVAVNRRVAGSSPAGGAFLSFPETGYPAVNAVCRPESPSGRSRLLEKPQ
jgi:hypothetical protein